MQKTRLTEIRTEEEFRLFITRKLCELEVLVSKLCKKDSRGAPEVVVFKWRRQQPATPAGRKE